MSVQPSAKITAPNFRKDINGLRAWAVVAVVLFHFVFYLLPYLCDGQFCQGTDPDKPRYYDDNHLTETGSRRLVPLFAGVFGNALPGFAAAAMK